MNRESAYVKKNTERILLLLGNHRSQKVQVSVLCTVRFFSEFNLRQGRRGMQDQAPNMEV